MGNCTTIGGVLLWNNLNGINLDDRRRRGGAKGQAVWPNCTFFRILYLIMEVLSLADRRLEGVRGP